METINRWRDQLLRAVEGAALLERPRRVQLEDNQQTLEGRIEIAGHKVTVALNVDPLFYNQLPVFMLRPWDALEFIPHVDPRGVICFLEPEGMVLDQRRQLDIVCDCFGHVRRTLHDGLTGANRGDFVDEFEIYWHRLNGGIAAISSLEPSDEAGEVVIASGQNPKAPLRLAHDDCGIRQIPDAYPNSGPWKAQRALYVPLEPGTMLVPPRSDRPFWTLSDVRALLVACSEPNRARLMRIIARRTYDPEYLVVRLLRPAGGPALFGIRFDGVGPQHPLIEEGCARRLTPITITRHDRSFFVQRGGGQMDLRDKRVLLLGCGSVGGYLAFELARAGVGSLGLVDDDLLLPENTYRHVLGKLYWYQKKAHALRHAIVTQLPYTEAHAIPERIEVALADGMVRLHEYDLIVSALGNPTSELAINEYVRGMADGPPIIFTWLEPLGIGGHAVLTGNGGEPGCFECLYTSMDADAALHNRASFGARDQTYSRSLAGCSSLYTPYASLDATQTAHLAARLAVNVLLGTERRNLLRSWRGSSEAFTQAGYALAPRYHLREDVLRQLETDYPNPDCRICRGL